jgi:hypothetical protein
MLGVQRCSTLLFLGGVAPAQRFERRRPADPASLWQGPWPVSFLFQQGDPRGRLILVSRHPDRNRRFHPLSGGGVCLDRVRTAGNASLPISSRAAAQSRLTDYAVAREFRLPTAGWPAQGGRESGYSPWRHQELMSPPPALVRGSEFNLRRLADTLHRRGVRSPWHSAPPKRRT